MSKIALVISGGGAKGAFAVGVLKHLFNTYRKDGWFDITGGTSTGALIAPMAALMGASEPLATQALETLVELYTTVKTEDILERQNLFEILRRRDCLNETGPLKELLRRHITQTWFDWLQSGEAPYCYVVYTNYQTGRKITASPKLPGMTRERFIQAMLASASVPGVMEGVIIDNELCYDGGMRDLLPFSEAIKQGAERIVPIFLTPELLEQTSERLNRIDKILLKTMDIMLDEAGRNDYQMANLINVGLRAKQDILDAFIDDPAALGKLRTVYEKPEYADMYGPEKRLIEIVTGLRPDNSLTDDSLTFDPVEMSIWVNWGRRKAQRTVVENPFR